MCGLADLLSSQPHALSRSSRQPIDEETGREIERTLAVVRCPSCGRRDSNAVTRLWLRAIAPGGFVVAMFGGLLAGLLLLAHRVDPSDPRVSRLAWIGAVVVLGLAALVSLARRPRWPLLDRRVRFLESSDDGGGYRSA